MKILTLILLLTLSSIAGILPEGNKTPTIGETDAAIDSSISDVDKFSTELESDLKKLAEDKAKASEHDVVKYFEDIEYTSDSSLVCPPLLPDWQQKNYTTRVEYINPRMGEIRCSVLLENTTENHKPIFQKSFVNNTQRNRYKFINVLDPDQYRQSRVNQNAINVNDSFEEYLNQSVTNKTDDYAAKKQINYIDLLDAIAGLNRDYIDLQQSINQQSLVLKNGYILNVNTSEEDAFYKSELLDTLRAASSEVLDRNGLETINPFDKENAENKRITENQKLEKLAQYDAMFIINWFVDIQPILGNLFIALALIIIVYNLSHKIYESYERKNDESQKRKIIVAFFFVVSMLLLFVSNTGGSVRITDTIEQTKEIKLFQNRIQQQLSWVYMKVNDMADELVRKTIETQLKTHHAKHNIISSKTIHNIDNELEIKTDLLKDLKEIEGMCQTQYKFAVISNEYKKNDVVKTTNIYPYSDDEALKFFENPYQITLKNDFIVEEKLSKDILSFSACHYNLNLLNQTKKSITDLSRKIDDFNSLNSLDQNRAKIELINATMWNIYDKLGYFSIAFVPVLESIQRTYDLFEEKETEYKAMIFDSENSLDDLADFVVKNVWLAVFFDTSSIQHIISKAAALLPTSWIPFVGDTLQKATELAATLIIVDLLSEFPTILKVAFFMILATFALFIAWFQKLVVFLITPFYILLAFADRSVEKFTRSLGSIIFYTIKPILVILAIVFAIIASNIFGFVWDILTNSGSELLTAQEGFFTYLINGLFEAVFKLIFYVLEFWMIWWIVMSMPSMILEKLQLQIQDSATSIASSIEHKVGGNVAPKGGA